MGTVTDLGAYFDRDGEPITLAQWQAHRADESYRVLARDTVAGRIVITTWMGRDQGPFHLQTRPLIFGTVVYDPATKSYDDHGETFAATATEALANHQRALAELT